MVFNPDILMLFYPVAGFSIFWGVDKDQMWQYDISEKDIRFSGIGAREPALPKVTWPWNSDARVK